MKIKECVIHIDGVDKTGKDVIKDKLIELSNGKCLIIVRSYISQIVYSRLYNRNINEKYFIDKMYKAYDNGEHFIFLDANKETLKKRFIKHDEKDIQIKDIQKNRDYFKKSVKEFKMRILYIDTSNKSVCDCCKIILEYVNEKN